MGVSVVPLPLAHLDIWWIVYIKVHMNWGLTTEWWSGSIHSSWAVNQSWASYF